MALQMVGPTDLRKYNPDRDMLWAMHRFFKYALLQLGDGSDDTLRELMVNHGIDPPVDSPKGEMAQFVSLLASIAADPLLKETKDPGTIAEELLGKLFNETDPKFVSVRTLFCVVFLKGILCEYPLWCAMTRPKHPNDPLPNQDEIETAAREFLDKVRS